MNSTDGNMDMGTENTDKMLNPLIEEIARNPNNIKEIILTNLNLLFDYAKARYGDKQHFPANLAVFREQLTKRPIGDDSTPLIKLLHYQDKENVSILDTIVCFVLKKPSPRIKFIRKQIYGGLWLASDDWEDPSEEAVIGRHVAFEIEKAEEAAGIQQACEEIRQQLESEGLLPLEEDEDFYDDENEID